MRSPESLPGPSVLERHANLHFDSEVDVNNDASLGLRLRAGFLVVVIIVVSTGQPFDFKKGTSYRGMSSKDFELPQCNVHRQKRLPHMKLECLKLFMYLQGCPPLLSTARHRLFPIRQSPPFELRDMADSRSWTALSPRLNAGCIDGRPAAAVQQCLPAAFR
ncbi:hypothetical protein BJ546DRAFT_600841 [Cryomyces antarcticus]